ncbi:MBL fold metallo-hydrolase [Chloroflexota bacterium]
MKLHLTTLSENTAGAGHLLGEWGLSILVETDETNILFDAGQGASASHNADILGVDLSKVDRIVLSHGHYDHSGGLRHVLRKIKKEVEIIAHPDIWQAKYSRREQNYRYIGIPFQRQELENLGARFRLTTEPIKITDSVMTTGEIPMETAFEGIPPDRFYIQSDGRWQPDSLLDDLALIINTSQGLLVILGCAHRGMINTLQHARKLTGAQKIHMVVGGCHLVDAPRERIQATIASLKELAVEKTGVSHCTSLLAAATMAHELGERFFFNTAGTSIDLP